MTRRSSFAPGTPCWADVSHPDPAAGAAFYASLLGWTTDLNDQPDGPYAMMRLGDAAVAGVGGLAVDGESSRWTIYMSVADAEASIARAIAHGGSVTLGPSPVGDTGIVALVADSTGSRFGLWQPLSTIGADEMGGEGSMVWAELSTHDPAHARRFYADTFMWTEHGDIEDDHAVLAVDAEPIVSVRHAPEGEPNAWRPWFGVGDVSAVCAEAERLGGTQLGTGARVRTGKGILTGAVLADPAGATFGILPLG